MTEVATGWRVVIPARAASTRLPNKALANLAGRPMVVRVAEQARASGAVHVCVATDSTDIAEAVQHHGFEAELTRTDHPSGTDRLAEVCQRHGWPDDDIIVNVQGDEPLIEPQLIAAVAQCLQRHPDAAAATAACPISDYDTLVDPAAVKVVCDAQARALYFSRAPIPWARDHLAEHPHTLPPNLPARLHIGIYAYRAGFLRSFPLLPRGRLEAIESLEQLRLLEHGHTIVVHDSPWPPARGVDTPEDLERVRAVFQQRE